MVIVSFALYTLEMLVRFLVASLKCKRRRIVRELVKSIDFWWRFVSVLHTMDAWHDGESIAEHTYGVFCRAYTGSKGLDRKQRRQLLLAAYMHDFGKAFTALWNTRKNKMTFYGHAEISTRLARKLFGDRPDPVVEDMVLNHDIVHSLWHSRKEGSLRYLRKFVDTPLANNPLLFILAASDAQPKVREHTLASIAVIKEELNRYRKERDEGNHPEGRKRDGQVHVRNFPAKGGN